MVESALIRPSMYTVGGSVLEVAAFLEGYYSGLAKGSPKSDHGSAWSDFVAAIAGDGHPDWHTVFRDVNLRFNSCDEAFDWLLSVYLESSHRSA